MKKLFVPSLLALAVLLQFCSSSKKTSSTKETIATKTVAPKVNFVKDVQPLLASKCAPCHMPPDGKKLYLDTYSAAADNIDEIISRIKLSPTERGFMPLRKTKLSDSVIHVFEQWKADGLAKN